MFGCRGLLWLQGGGGVSWLGGCQLVAKQAASGGQWCQCYSRGNQAPPVLLPINNIIFPFRFASILVSK